jgi:hypothetical protein
MSSDAAILPSWPIAGIALIAFGLLLVPILSKVPRSRGTNVLYHVVYIIVAVSVLLLLPETIQDLCFSVRTIVVHTRWNAFPRIPSIHARLSTRLSTTCSTLYLTHAFVLVN